ncbi:MAG: crossover junction endodeoxyribonuclease RuvC [Deltaproteobacteria bacterium]|jgi:crossover junction endodeoxyribonuclease RuvC|nr:crossover junction endodeoxyribonuclease RuvC [Deltaproteobacteria bacterium]
MPQNPLIRIIGVDPSSRITGYGIIDYLPNELELVAYGTIQAQEETLPERLKHIHLTLLQILSQYNPTVLALEDIFVFRNPQALFKLAEARGVIMLTAALKDLLVYEYPPRLVKNTVCGHGHAEKSQVAYMIKQIFHITENLPPDASDALAIALCHAGKLKIEIAPVPMPLASKSRSKSWRKLSPEDLATLGYKLEK